MCVVNTTCPAMIPVASADPNKTGDSDARDNEEETTCADDRVAGVHGTQDVPDGDDGGAGNRDTEGMDNTAGDDNVDVHNDEDLSGDDDGGGGGGSHSEQDASSGDNADADSHDTANVPVVDAVDAGDHDKEQVNCADDGDGGSHDNENMSGGDDVVNVDNICSIDNERIPTKKADDTKMQRKNKNKSSNRVIEKLQDEFNQLLLPYAEESGITEDDIDHELADAQKRMTHLRREGRDQTPESQLLQLKINDFERLVKLRALMVEAQIQEHESEFNKLLMPYTQQSGITEHHVDAELAYAQARMANLRTKDRQDKPDGKALQRKINDFERLVELRGLIMEKHAPDTHPTTQKVQSEFGRLVHPHAEDSSSTQNDLDEDLPKA